MRRRSGASLRELLGRLVVVLRYVVPAMLASSGGAETTALSELTQPPPECATRALHRRLDLLDGRAVVQASHRCHQTLCEGWVDRAGHPGMVAQSPPVRHLISK